MTKTYQSGAAKPSTKAGRREQGREKGGKGREKRRGEARRRCAWLQQRPRGSSHSGVPDAASRNQSEICCSLGLLTSCLLGAEGVCVCSIRGGPSSQASSHLDPGTWANPVRSQYQARS